VTKEDWIEIEEYPNYAVSNYGYVHNLRRGYSLKPRSNGRGYFQVCLSHRGSVSDFYVHLLVAGAFLADYRPGLQVGHKNEDLSDNHIDNLYIKNAPPPVGSSYVELPARGRKVQIVETGEVFMNARNAANYIRGSYSRVYKCLANPHMTHMGYHFVYLEE
jgi:hypothetical protein